MNLEGDTSVIDAVKEKKRLIDAGESHEHIRPLLIMDGGFMKGVYGVGAALAMNDLEYVEVFDSYVGISSGAATLAYTLTDQAELGATVIRDECTAEKFVNFWRWSNPQDSKYLQDVFEGSTGKKMDVQRLQNKNFYIGVSNFETATPVLLQLGMPQDWYVALRASMSMPGAVTDKIYLNGVRYIDGASSEPHILQYACKQIEATHILIITNQDKETGDILWWDKLLTRTLFRFRVPQPLRDVVLRRRKIRHAWVAERLAHPTTPTLFAWGDGSVKSFERDKEKVQNTVDRSRAWWADLLS